MDQALHLGHTAAGHQAVIQVAWRYHRPVDLGALEKFRDNLAHGRLARLIRPALLPFGRHQWVVAPPALSAIAATAPLDPARLQTWLDAQVELPLDPEHGPAWTLTAQHLTNGDTIVSLVVSHCIADGTSVALAVAEAVAANPVLPAYPAISAQHSVADIVSELWRTVQDLPVTFRALARAARMFRFPRLTSSRAVSKKLLKTTPDRTIAFASIPLRIPTTMWDAKAKNLGANRLTLLAAITTAFASALGRVRDGDVTMLIPVNLRQGQSEAAGNCVSLASLKMSVDAPDRRLTELQRRLRSTLLRTRKETDPIEMLLPLVPFVPSSVVERAGHLAFAALSELPVTCSYLGKLPQEILRIDGADADEVCFRGTDRQVSLEAIEARQGVATLFGGVVSDHMHLNFVAYQPGVVTQSRHLHMLVEQILAQYGLSGEFFDA